MCLPARKGRDEAYRGTVRVCGFCLYLFGACALPWLRALYYA